MRQKIHVDSKSSDHQLFRALALDDTWPDAELVQLWSYLYGNKQLLIPATWQSTMAELNAQLLDTATRLDY